MFDVTVWISIFKTCEIGAGEKVQRSRTLGCPCSIPDFHYSNPHGDLKPSITPVPESDTSNPGAPSTFTYINAGSFVIYKSIGIKNTCEVNMSNTCIHYIIRYVESLADHQYPL